MYIHRIVVDASRINAKLSLSGMNYLEKLHQLGLVELQRTSTLSTDMPPRPSEISKKQQLKAISYPRIGGSSVALTESTTDSQHGTSGRPSHFLEIQKIIFGEFNSREHLRVHDQRDALHIDQANQHDTDFFVTNDGLVRKANERLQQNGFLTHICNDDECAAIIQDYFNRNYGTTDPKRLALMLKDCGPILIGSSSCGDTTFIDAVHQEELLGFDVNESGAGIDARIYDHTGTLLLTITPGKSLNFSKPDLSVAGEAAPNLPAAVLVGVERCSAFVIRNDSQPVLAGRMLLSGRLLIYRAMLHNASGDIALVVERENLELSRISCSVRGRKDIPIGK